jgi:hypothetical protein
MSDTNNTQGQPPPQEPKLLVRFKPEQKSPTAKVSQSNYRRTFDRAKQPFEVTESEWSLHLERTGLFEVVPEKKPAGQQQGGQQQQGTQQQGGGQQS